MRGVHVNTDLSGDLAARSAGLRSLEREHGTLGDCLDLPASTATGTHTAVSKMPPKLRSIPEDFGNSSGRWNDAIGLDVNQLGSEVAHHQ
jgi:hypothetical protein